MVTLQQYHGDCSSRAMQHWTKSSKGCAVILHKLAAKEHEIT